jgi:hypothetical protein
MRKAFLIVFVIGLAFFTIPSHAQKVSVFGHLAIPIGDFGDEASDKAGYAGLGFGGGIELAIPTSTPNFSFIAQARIVVNSVDENALQNDLEEFWWLWWFLEDPDLDLEDFDLDVGKYINIPLMGGAKFNVDVTPEVSFSGKGLIGVNFARIPKFEFPMTIYDWDYGDYFLVDGEMEPDGTFTTFCFGLGASFTVNERWQIGFEYLNLGEADVEGEQTLSVIGYSEKYDYDYEQPISMMTVYAGYAF